MKGMPKDTRMQDTMSKEAESREENVILISRNLDFNTKGLICYLRTQGWNAVLCQ